MAESPGIVEKEISSSEIKVYLNEWKEIIVLSNALLVWKNNWFPLIIFLAVTSIYLYIWLMCCSMLNIICTIGACVTLLDYFVCGPFQNMISPNSWSVDKEFTYTTFAESVANFILTSKLYVKQFFKLRQTNYKLFHSVLLVSFVSLLYIGTIVNYFFLSYITVLAILFYPGYKNRSELIKESLEQCSRIAATKLFKKEKNT